MTANFSEPPVAEYGCFECVPSHQGDLLFYFIVLSPFLFTLVVSYFFVRRAQSPIGILKQMAISVPGALPAAIVLGITFENELIRVATTAIVAGFIWAATIGPGVVFFAQWIYLELKRLRQRADR